jgi:hypothetical protein
MFCPKCRSQNNQGANFCRKCGADLESAMLAPFKPSSIDNKVDGRSLTKIKSIDPDELTAGGIANIIIGDGFFMVAVILSATHSSVSSLLWLFLLIPAFYLFGRGFADVLHARQIQRRMKKNELDGVPKTAELLPSRESVIDTAIKHTSGELVPLPSVTEGTTRELG